MSRFIYFWKEGFRNIFSHGFMSLTAVIIMIACLLMTGTVTLVAYNLNVSIVKLQNSNEIVVWVEEDLTTREAKTLGDKIDDIDNVATMKFVTRDEALEAYRIKLGEDASQLDDFNSANNPLRHSFHITLKDSAIAADTIAQLESVDDGVAEVTANQNVIDKLLQIQNIFNIVSLIMVIAIAVISIFIISNTVKLTMFARREEISIQKMVGATNSFIRWPFVIEGMFLGVVAGGASFFAQWGVYQEMGNLATSIPYLEIIPFQEIQFIVLGIFIGAGVLFGIGGSITSIRKFMNV